MYVGYGDGALAVIDPEKVKKLADIKLDGHPESFQLEAQGKRIFVNVPSASQVAVIDREKRAVVARWDVKQAGANFPMALDEANHRLFLGCRQPAKVLVLDAEAGARWRAWTAAATWTTCSTTPLASDCTSPAARAA